MPRDDTETESARSHREREHLRFGVIGGVGFPRPLAIEGLLKLERTVAIGAEYSVLPTVTVSGVQTSFWALAADARIFPFQGAFFVGMRAGRQHLGADGSLTVDRYGTFTESKTVDTTFRKTRIGFLWTSPEPGFTVIGLDAGSPDPDRIQRVDHDPSASSLAVLRLCGCHECGQYPPRKVRSSDGGSSLCASGSCCDRTTHRRIRRSIATIRHASFKVPQRPRLTLKSGSSPHARAASCPFISRSSDRSFVRCTPLHRFECCSHAFPAKSDGRRGRHRVPGSVRADGASRLRRHGRGLRRIGPTTLRSPRRGKARRARCAQARRGYAAGATPSHRAKPASSHGSRIRTS